MFKKCFLLVSFLVTFFPSFSYSKNLLSMIVLKPDPASSEDKSFEEKLSGEFIKALKETKTFEIVLGEKDASKSLPSFALLSFYYVDKGKLYIASRIVDTKTAEVLAGFSKVDTMENIEDVCLAAAKSLLNQLLVKHSPSYKAGTKKVAPMNWTGKELSYDELLMTTEMFTSSLASCSKFRTVERAHLDKLLNLYEKLGIKSGTFVSADEILTASEYLDETKWSVKFRRVDVEDGKSKGEFSVPLPYQNLSDILTDVDSASKEVCKAYK